MKVIIPLFALLLLTLSIPVTASTLAGVVLQDSSLHAEPFSDAQQLGSLAARSTITVLQRQGGWYQVRDGQQREGWLHMSRVRLGGAASGSSVDLQGLSQAQRLLQSGRSGSSGTTVATGIRGLDAEDLGKASPNHQAVRQLAAYQADARAARQFAELAQLHQQSVAYLREKK
ncbi:MAG: SH3 domain-containing protein [Chromatiales bacterium]|nr:SH3 domain-containing protein [Gammaproteobacteria bacterium]MBW6476393.1 SH3 domain-containing protein [Chromatiales bacterium]